MSGSEPAVGSPGDPTASRFDGPYGSAERLAVPDTEAAAETVCHWLLRAPQAHPLWAQYMMTCVRLRDLPGWPPPHRQFPEATHELFVVALNPEHGPYDAAKVAGYAEQGGGLPFLTPVNIAEQFTAADGEMTALAAWAAWGVTVGALWPETADAPAKIRRLWSTSLAKTLAHIRGKPHST